MSVDWNQIRSSYEGGGSSLRRVAERFGVSVSTLLKRAAREEWKQHAAVDSISGVQDGIKGINRPELDSNLESTRGIKPSDQTEFDSISGVQDGIKGINLPELDSNLESTGGIKPAGQTEFDSISEVQDGIKGINLPELDSNLESTGGIKPSGQTEFDSISGVQDGIKGINRPELDSKLESTRGIKGINHTEFDSTPGHGWVIPEDIHSWDRLRAATFYHQQLGWAVHPLVPPDRGDDKERGKKPCSKGWRDHKAADVTPEDLHEVFSS